jgi:hypothetical protein
LSHGLGHVARRVSRFDRRALITPSIRAGLEPLGRHDRCRANTCDLSANTADTGTSVPRVLGPGRVREVAAQTRGAQDRDSVRRRLSRVRTTAELHDAFGQ